MLETSENRVRGLQAVRWLYIDRHGRVMLLQVPGTLGKAEKGGNCVHDNSRSCGGARRYWCVFSGHGFLFDTQAHLQAESPVMRNDRSMWIEIGPWDPGTNLYLSII